MNKKKLTTAALLAVITTGLAATVLTPVVAAELQHKADEKTMEQTQTKQDYIKVSDDALMTMRNVGGARLAIFDGAPDRAQIYVDAAVTRASATLRDADKYALDIKAAKNDGEKYVPFNAGLSVAETLVPNKENMKHISRANGQMHKGQTKKAVETLKVNGIDVALSTELLPIKAAKVEIEDAAKLIGDGKYYQANLVLKSVEDSVITEVFNTDAIPKTADHS
ncbi:MAG: YfdX family protein [Gammaproteobacteria bacterium]|nr:YfdX family protein [Gammaproteobacteria bacterium]